MGIVHRYSLIVAACAAVLVGAQAPAFIDQYEKRLDAHYREVSENLRGYQDIADRYHGRSLERLIEKHERSGDPTFRDEAQPLREMFQRLVRFRDERAAMDTHLFGKAVHLAVDSDEELLGETLADYSYAVTLDRESVLAAVTFAVIVLLLLETMIRMVRAARRLRRRTMNGRVSPH